MTSLLDSIERRAVYRHQVERGIRLNDVPATRRDNIVCEEMPAEHRARFRCLRCGATLSVSGIATTDELIDALMWRADHKCPDVRERERLFGKLPVHMRDLEID